jgi:hypothetical protein
MTRRTSALGGRGTGEECGGWTPTSVAPSGACFNLGPEPTADAVGYRLSVLRTCRGSEACTPKCEGRTPASVRQSFAASRLFRPRLSVKGKGRISRKASKPPRGWKPRQWGRVYILYICQNAGSGCSKCKLYGRDPIVVSAELEFRGICRLENRRNSGQRRRLLRTTAPAFLPSSIGATHVQSRIGGLDPSVEAGRERRLAQATGMPEKGWSSNRQTAPVFAQALTPLSPLPHCLPVSETERVVAERNQKGRKRGQRNDYTPRATASTPKALRPQAQGWPRNEAYPGSTPQANPTATRLWPPRPIPSSCPSPFVPFVNFVVITRKLR